MTETATTTAPPPAATEVETVEPHDRTCYACGQTDDHPRLVIDDTENYHYDCIPAGMRAGNDRVAEIPDDHPAIVATSKGKRGDDVRAAVLNSDLTPEDVKA